MTSKHMHTSVVKQRNIKQSKCTLPLFWREKTKLSEGQSLTFLLSNQVFANCVCIYIPGEFHHH